MDESATTENPDNAITSSTSTSTNPFGFKEETIQLEIGKKLRTIGKAVVNSKGVYTEFICANTNTHYRPGGEFSFCIIADFEIILPDFLGS